MVFIRCKIVSKGVRNDVMKVPRGVIWCRGDANKMSDWDRKVSTNVRKVSYVAREV